MHNSELITAGIPDFQEVATAVNDVAAITLPSPGVRAKWLILSVTISMNGDPTTNPSFTIVSGGVDTLERIDFPNAACAPYNSRGIYKGGIGANGVGEAVVLSLPALGVAVRGTVSVRAIKVPASGF